MYTYLLTFRSNSFPEVTAITVQSSAENAYQAASKLLQMHSNTMFHSVEIFNDSEEAPVQLCELVESRGTVRGNMP